MTAWALTSARPVGAGMRRRVCGTSGVDSGGCAIGDVRIPLGRPESLTRFRGLCHAPSIAAHRVGTHRRRMRPRRHRSGKGDSMRSPSGVRAFVILVALGLVLGACRAVQQSPGSQSGAAQPSSDLTGGTVRIGIGGSPDSLNPGNGLLAEAYTLYELVYDTPIKVNVDGSFSPEIATAWEPSADGLTWTLTIRDDVVFHDGTPLTAEDVAFSIQLYKDTPDFPYLPSYATYFKTIEAPDPTTVVLTTKAPLGNFEANIVFMYVLPKHI